MNQREKALPCRRSGAEPPVDVKHKIRDLRIELTLLSTAVPSRNPYNSMLKQPMFWTFRRQGGWDLKKNQGEELRYDLECSHWRAELSRMRN